MKIAKAMGPTFWSDDFEVEMRHQNGLPPMPHSLGWWEPRWLYNLRMNISDGRSVRAKAVERWL